MSDKEVQQAFEEWFDTYNGSNKHECEAMEEGWLAGVQWERERPIGCMVDPTSRDEQIEKLQAQLVEAEKEISGAYEYLKATYDIHTWEDEPEYAMMKSFGAYLEKCKGGE